MIFPFQESYWVSNFQSSGLRNNISELNKKHCIALNATVDITSTLYPIRSTFLFR